jgi:hypothetical protein
MKDDMYFRARAGSKMNKRKYMNKEIVLMREK